MWFQCTRRFKSRKDGILSFLNDQSMFVGGCGCLFLGFQTASVVVSLAGMTVLRAKTGFPAPRCLMRKATVVLLTVPVSTTHNIQFPTHSDDNGDRRGI